ncbi:MAG: type II toxin-antitoxin system ParD family antitoxin [Planctomycetota bacterium]
MTYQFPRDVAERIDAQLGTGEYASTDDVLRDALQALENHKRCQREWMSLRAQLRVAEEQSKRGESGPLDAEATKRAVRERLAQQGIVE